MILRYQEAADRPILILMGNKFKTFFIDKIQQILESNSIPNFKDPFLTISAIKMQSLQTIEV